MIEKILVRAPDVLKNKMREIADKRGATLNQLILQILWEWLKEEKREKQ